MLLRRGAFYALFPLAAALPVWILVSRGVVADGIGWEFLVYLVAAPILFVALAATAAVIVGRKSVRAARAVSTVDVVLLAAGWLSLIAAGLFAVPLLAALVVLLVTAAFWFAVWELVDETRRRVKTFVDDLALTPQRPSTRPSQQRTRTPGDAGRIVVVKPPEAGTPDRSQN